jgi:hypothetical protein
MGRFRLGALVWTPGARDAFDQAEESPLPYLRRHINGDWGDVSKEDAHENEFSVDHNLRIFSVYHLKDNTKIWIITEADRSATTILLPEEY